MSGGGGGFGVEEEEEDEVNDEWTKFELGTGKPGRGEAPAKISNYVKSKSREWASNPKNSLTSSLEKQDKVTFFPHTD